MLLTLSSSIAESIELLKFVNKYDIKGTNEIENKIYYQIEVNISLNDIEFQLDDLSFIIPSLRYVLIKDNNDNTFYRVHINKKMKKIVTKRATKLIGLH
uniref:Uncharacterized protein n=1 Tax=Mimiviridae sp. ChoanoV1 TaxID=2596887 RepID=A0A5B8IEC0_9VIRU|nr:hypothetical protein 6_28 [Mimiviridae sp. ChoanoV1]